MPTGDCERLVDGLLVQPVNALSSLLFIVAGIAVVVVVRKSSYGSPWLGWSFSMALALVGVGSFGFHGSGGPVAGWAHDASISALLLLVLAVEFRNRAAWSTRWVLGGWLVVAATLAEIEAVWPPVADPLNAPLALLAVAGVAGWRPGPDAVAAGPPGREIGVVVGMIVMAAGVLIMLLSRTDGPLCDPETLIQGHAIWHVLASAGVGIYAISVSGRTTGRPTEPA